jgi:hypothetical protein
VSALACPATQSAAPQRELMIAKRIAQPCTAVHSIVTSSNDAHNQSCKALTVEMDLVFELRKTRAQSQNPNRSIDQDVRQLNSN